MSKASSSGKARAVNHPSHSGPQVGKKTRDFVDNYLDIYVDVLTRVNIRLVDGYIEAYEQGALTTAQYEKHMDDMQSELTTHLNKITVAPHGAGPAPRVQDDKEADGDTEEAEESGGGSGDEEEGGGEAKSKRSVSRTIKELPKTLQTIREKSLQFLFSAWKGNNRTQINRVPTTPPGVQDPLMVTATSMSWAALVRICCEEYVKKNPKADTKRAQRLITNCVTKLSDEDVGELIVTTKPLYFSKTTTNFTNGAVPVDLFRSHVLEMATSADKYKEEPVQGVLAVVENVVKFRKEFIKLLSRDEREAKKTATQAKKKEQLATDKLNDKLCKYKQTFFQARTTADRRRRALIGTKLVDDNIITPEQLTELLAQEQDRYKKTLAMSVYSEAKEVDSDNTELGKALMRETSIDQEMIKDIMQKATKLSKMMSTLSTTSATAANVEERAKAKFSTLLAYLPHSVRDTYKALIAKEKVIKPAAPPPVAAKPVAPATPAPVAAKPVADPPAAPIKVRKPKPADAPVAAPPASPAPADDPPPADRIVAVEDNANEDRIKVLMALTKPPTTRELYDRTLRHRVKKILEGKPLLEVRLEKPDTKYNASLMLAQHPVVIRNAAMSGEQVRFGTDPASKFLFGCSGFFSDRLLEQARGVLKKAVPGVMTLAQIVELVLRVAIRDVNESHFTESDFGMCTQVGDKYNLDVFQFPVLASKKLSDQGPIMWVREILTTLMRKLPQCVEELAPYIRAIRTVEGLPGKFEGWKHVAQVAQIVLQEFHEERFSSIPFDPVLDSVLFAMAHGTRMVYATDIMEVSEQKDEVNDEVHRYWKSTKDTLTRYREFMGHDDQRPCILTKTICLVIDDDEPEEPAPSASNNKRKPAEEEEVEAPASKKKTVGDVPPVEASGGSKRSAEALPAPKPKKAKVTTDPPAPLPVAAASPRVLQTAVQLPEGYTKPPFVAMRSKAPAPAAPALTIAVAAVQKAGGGWSKSWVHLNMPEKAFIVEQFTKEALTYCKDNNVRVPGTENDMHNYFHEVADAMRVTHVTPITLMKMPLERILDGADFLFEISDIKVAYEALGDLKNGTFLLKGIIFSFLRTMYLRKNKATPPLIADLFNGIFGPNPTSGESESATSSGEEVGSDGEPKASSSSEEDEEEAEGSGEEEEAESSDESEESD